MSRRKKPEAEEQCPLCGCPELQTYARQTAEGFRVYTSCSACAHVIPEPAPAQTHGQPALGIAARAALVRMERTEAEEDGAEIDAAISSLVLERRDLQALRLAIENIVAWWSSSDEESSDTPAFQAMSRVVAELAKPTRRGLKP